MAEARCRGYLAESSHDKVSIEPNERRRRMYDRNERMRCRARCVPALRGALVLANHSESVRVGGDIVVPTRFAAAVFPQTQSFKVSIASLSSRLLALIYECARAPTVMHEPVCVACLSTLRGLDVVGGWRQPLWASSRARA